MYCYREPRPQKLLEIEEKLGAGTQARLSSSLRFRMAWRHMSRFRFGIGQKCIEDSFTELDMKKNSTVTKMPPWTKQKGDLLVLNEGEQTRYTSVLGKLVWLDRPDICPAVI